MIKKFISKYSEELKTILYGILYTVVVLAIWWHIAGNPIVELNLILSAKDLTNGFIVDAWEDISEGDEGGSSWTHSYHYEYQTPDGKKFDGAEQGNGRIAIDLKHPHPIEVEYLPDDPTVSRIKGSGNADIGEWLWRKIGLGGILLIMFIAPGFIVIRNGINDIKKNKNSNHL